MKSVAVTKLCRSSCLGVSRRLYEQCWKIFEQTRRGEDVVADQLAVSGNDDQWFGSGHELLKLVLDPSISSPAPFTFVPVCPVSRALALGLGALKIRIPTFTCRAQAKG